MKLNWHCTLLQVIRILTEKAKEQDALLQQFDITEKDHIELKAKFKELIEQSENQKNQFTLLVKDNTILMEKQEKLLSDNKRLTEDKEYLVGVLTNACEVIKHSLQVRKCLADVLFVFFLLFSMI